MLIITLLLVVASIADLVLVLNEPVYVEDKSSKIKLNLSFFRLVLSITALVLAIA